MSLYSDNFKQEQLKYPRVREAYKSKKETVKQLLNAKSIKIDQLQLYFRAFKSEDELEVWGKNKNDKRFQLIKKYEVCRKSGTSGPKREQGDLQVPEGFYHINRFNPYSA
ncbi:hypothetical protein CW751_14180 [Brumimicrobium salinarum]|uniref:Uncharacterized protein n=1 Tax=Brumimicrobium salinarum TaxID=2058658 RepID=A0A2I0QZ78_9FLAO|nr:hypothetical protein [Brumimicrobium salinarum]PKR79635.1 hypothetical protein CW751_14180 [Brumimicrobium salinarum]